MTEQKKPKATSPSKVTTPKFRVSFPQVFEAKSFNGGDAKFSLTMLFPKSTDLKDLRRAVNYVLSEKFGPDKAKWPKNLKSPFRDGSDKPDLEGYEDCYFVSARSIEKPGLVDQGLHPILNSSDFYAGCYARATLNAFYYDHMGNKGVAFGLNNIQKMADGEAFSGRKRAENDFDAVEDSSEDSSNYESEDEEDGYDDKHSIFN